MKNLEAAFIKKGTKGNLIAIVPNPTFPAQGEMLILESSYGLYGYLKEGTPLLISNSRPTKTGVRVATEYSIPDLEFIKDGDMFVVNLVHHGGARVEYFRTPLVCVDENGNITHFQKNIVVSKATTFMGLKCPVIKERLILSFQQISSIYTREVQHVFDTFVSETDTVTV